MRPKEPARTGQHDMFRSRLDQILNMNHEKVVLADAVANLRRVARLEPSGAVLRGDVGEPPLGVGGERCAHAPLHLGKPRAHVVLVPAGAETAPQTEAPLGPISRVLEVFRPRSFDVVLWHPGEPALPASEDYRLYGHVATRLPCGYHVQFLSFHRPLGATLAPIDLTL